jgi:hypothetical protein
MLAIFSHHTIILFLKCLFKYLLNPLEFAKIIISKTNKHSNNWNITYIRQFKKNFAILRLKNKIFQKEMLTRMKFLFKIKFCSRALKEREKIREEMSK